jgi:Arc/MetJ family transcription regulator
MRTNVLLDDDLVEEAFALTGVRTKRELVRLALP